MASVCLYLHAHQPWRIKNFSIFDIGGNHSYFDEQRNLAYLDRIAKKSYLPTNKILLDLIRETDGRFKVSFSISGTLLEQLEKYAPEVIKSFQDLVKTGRVELLAETYYHSLSYLYSKEEFKEQVNLHRNKFKKLFNYQPKVFRNTELMFSNEMAKFVQGMRYQGILAEGASHILGWRSPNFTYRVKTADKIRVLLRNFQLSDDISFRFSTRDWAEWPLTAEKFTNWVNQVNGNGEVVNLFMDYETFGEHQWEDTGIFDFLRAFPHKVLEHPDNDFKTPSEIIAAHQSAGELDFHCVTSWADTERDLSAWLGNSMQKKSLESIYALEKEILASGDQEMMEDWRKLQTSDHFYYMCTKWFADGDVHKYFNPYDSPYDCFISYMNIINDLKLRLEKKVEKIII
ncbi:glycoside hydrolase family 57 protein [Patescibacteria group bacterium]|nr:glycoside hydrolase family 57 protein [Patescibacteria group bacterium]MCG2809147.1 glycoside hydrolase family 57 protein [Candidatus Portnoybacteria bacterium]